MLVLPDRGVYVLVLVWLCSLKWMEAHENVRYVVLHQGSSIPNWADVALSVSAHHLRVGHLMATSPKQYQRRNRRCIRDPVCGSYESSALDTSNLLRLLLYRVVLQSLGVAPPGRCHFF